MTERLLQSDGINELAKALCAVQGAMHGALKDSENPFFKSRYADLESVWESCRHLLHANGLSVIQTTVPGGLGIELVTTLIHVSGQWMRGYLPIMAAKQDPQGIGAAITYSRRYAMAAILGVVQVDDDGETAQGRGEYKPSHKAPAVTSKAPAMASPTGSPGLCVLCGSTLTLSKAGTTYFCPNWKDTSKGAHPRVPVNLKPKAPDNPPPFDIHEDDVPF